MIKRQNQSGFTLVELLVVLVILGLLVGLAGPRVMRYLGSSRADTALVQVEQFRTALELFVLDLGRLPTTEQGLDALVQRPTGMDDWNGPYLRNDTLPLDPWGNPYLYVFEQDGTYTLRSLGADGVEGGNGVDADIGL